ncbi:VOC family protein [Draconibacterium sp.]|uniref:VOC family protein n=1 Tax=Draconibacterium sp. TaxID=1965318 RepID=UPI0035650C35
MATVNVYLNFNGNCREAFEFYKSVFGGDFSDVNTFGEMPPQEGMPPIPEEMKNNIMHIGLPISNETMLMGSDTAGEWAPKLEFGNNFSISVNTDNENEASKIFNALAVDGNITMPLNKTFWGAYFGMLTDKFGINWMVNCQLATPE